MAQDSGMDRVIKTIRVHSHGSTAEILVDGVAIRGVMSYCIEHEADSMPCLTLKILAKEIEFDGVCDVVTEIEAIG